MQNLVSQALNVKLYFPGLNVINFFFCCVRSVTFLDKNVKVFPLICDPEL